MSTKFEQPLRDAIQQMTDLLPSHIQISMSELAHHYSIRPGASAKILWDVARKVSDA